MSKKGQFLVKIRYLLQTWCANKLEQAKKRKNNGADFCKSIWLNHTNNKICVPRTPREGERKILDAIFKDSKHFSKLKLRAKLILIFSKIIEKSSQGPNFYDFFCVWGYLSHNLYAFNEYKWQIHKIAVLGTFLLIFVTTR